MIKVLYISLFILLALSGAHSTVCANSWPVLDSLDNAYNEARTDSVRIDILFEVLNRLEFDDIDTSLVLSERVMHMVKQQYDTGSIVSIASHMAQLYAAQGNYRLALVYDQMVYDHANAVGDHKNVSTALNGMGESYLGLGLFNDAYINYQRALEKAEEIDDSLMATISTYNLGRLFKAAGQWTEAVEYIERSMELSEQINDRLGLAYSLHDLSDIYLVQQGDTGKMLASLQTGLRIAEEEEDDIIKPQILTKIAEFYFIQGQLSRSLDYYDKAFNIYQNQSNFSAMASIDLGRGKIAMLSGKGQKVRSYYEGAMKTAIKYGDQKLLMNAYNKLSEFYEGQGNYRRSLELYRKSRAMEDSMMLANRNEAFVNIHVDYEIAKKDRAIQKLNEQQRERQDQLKNEEFLRNVLVVILAFVGLLLITLYNNNVRRKNAHRVLLKHQKEIEEKSDELEKLLAVKDKFFSIVSHDLRSPIQALTGLLDMLDKDSLTQEELVEVMKPLRKRLGSTGKMLDNLLDWAMMEMDEIKIYEQEVSLKQMVEENFAFFNESNPKNIRFTYDHSTDVLLSADKNMLDLIIRNLISNAIKFTTEEGEIHVGVVNTNEKMAVVYVRDNGVGMNSKQRDNLFDSKVLYSTRGTANERGTGLGLRLCKEFIEKMGGKIWVESKEGKGSTFKFTVKTSEPHDDGEIMDVLPEE